MHAFKIIVVFIVISVCNISIVKSQTFTVRDTVVKAGDTLQRHLAFPYDAWELVEETKVFLDSMAVFLARNNYVVMQVRVHTGFRGNDRYNEKLSQKKAQSVVNYLVKANEISPDRLIAIGMGEKGLIVKEIDVAKMKTTTEQNDAQAKNSRTVFQIISVEYKN